MLNENATPAAREAALRADAAAIQADIMELVRQISEKNAVLSCLRDMIAEIDVYGAEDYFSAPSNDIKIEANHYDIYDF